MTMIHADGRVFHESTDIGNRDFQWFAEHPNTTVRVRPMEPEEMLQVKTRPGFVCTGGQMRVTKLDVWTHRRDGFDFIIELVERAQ
jgi:hypothetical protein